jgi:hypothetical protein
LHTGKRQLISANSETFFCGKQPTSDKAGYCRDGSAPTAHPTSATSRYFGDDEAINSPVTVNRLFRELAGDFVGALQEPFIVVPTHVAFLGDTQADYDS